MSSAASVGRDATLRLFLGLPVPRPDAERLAAWAAAALAGLATAPGVRLVRVEDLHVTLAFLGARPAGEAPAIVTALAEAVARADPVVLTPQRWRATGSVGMVALDDAGGAAARLARDVQDRLTALGAFRPEERPWLPHVTVARWRRRPRLAPGPPPGGTFVPSEAAAYISRLHPSGARYEVLERLPLDPSRRP